MEPTVSRRTEAAFALPTPFSMVTSSLQLSGSTSESELAHLQHIDQAKAARMQRRAHRRMINAILAQ
jgi:hypothetical protein